MVFFDQNIRLCSFFRDKLDIVFYLKENKLFKWKIDGNGNYNNAYIINETSSDCIKNTNYDQKCNIQSNLRYTGQKSDSEISCYAEQEDTFGDVLFSNEASIDIIIESGGITHLSVGQKAAIAIGILLTIFIIIAIIFLAWYFGWCCCKDRKNTTEKKLMVHDQPTNIERVKKF